MTLQKHTPTPGDNSSQSNIPFELPLVRGRYQFHTPLKNFTWFAVGGPTDVLFKPKDVDDLILFLKHNTAPLFTLGAGSNIIMRDGGIRGVVLRLSGDFSAIHIQDDHTVEVGAGCLDRTFALTCQSHGLSGMEFFISIPGTIGGALAMNAGAYGHETCDHLLWAEVVTSKGELLRLHPKEMGYSYRHCGLPKDWIFTKACFQVTPSLPTSIQQTMQDILIRRQETQPTKGRTGGSTFKNPTDYSAWKLIDEAGCRGMMVGDAMMSEKHCNFMLNLGNASSHDLEALGEKVRQEVLQHSGISLDWEILRVGEKA